MASKKKSKKKTKIKVGKELGKVGLLAVGLIGGNLVGIGIDKLLKVDNTTDEFKLNKLARPVILLGGGAAGAHFLKNDNLKLILSGVSASGIISGARTTVKVLLKKDILAGLVKGLGTADEVIRDFKKNIQIQPWSPDLPELDKLPDGVDYINIETPENIEGNFDDYQEVDEVELI